MKKILVLLLLSCSVNVFAQSEKKLKKIAAGITADNLKSKLSVIAGKEMEGRETATEGQRKAATYIQGWFEKLGLQPPSANGYQQFFTVFQDSISASSLMIDGSNYSFGKDYSISMSSLAAGNWKADSIVFVSFGIIDSLHNDFKNVDVKDKWVMIAEGKAEDADKPYGAVSYGFRNPASFFAKLINARSKGAKGVIIISKDFPKKQPYNVTGNMYIKASNVQRIPAVYISAATAFKMLHISQNNFSNIKNVQPGSYATSFSYSAAVKNNTLQSSNVIGVLPGTEKKDEYVFITAHYDHLGKEDSVIYYGADDDGSGTTSVLQLAEAFTKAAKKGYAPKRNIVFMTVSGEEEGLWGSEYYTQHPLFPLDKTTVDLNIDMVGRIDPERTYGDSMNYVYTIGEDKLSSDLLKISDSINNKFTKIELDRKFNDPKDPNRFYYRSDHYNFAAKGVPIIFYFNGTHADYHQPTDTVDKINFGLMAKRVQLVFYTAWDMANRNNMLVRDIPLK